jgi:hypothetical protein
MLSHTERLPALVQAAARKLPQRGNRTLTS